MRGIAGVNFDMPIIILSAAIALIGFLIWRMRTTTVQAHPLTRVEDTRIAAAAMMAAAAQADGHMTETERRVILKQARTTLGCRSDRQAEELLAEARWLVRDCHDLDNVFLRLMPLVRRICSPEQKGDLIRMLDEVLTAEGLPRPAEREAVARLSRELSY
jgi:uncharacterized tellurite resistance protein B-like protein